MAQIEFDFQAVREQNLHVEEIKGRLEQVICGEYEEIIQSLGIAWQGNEAEKFQMKMRVHTEKMKETVSLLGQVQEELRTVCTKMEEVEGMTVEMAEKRRY